MTVQAWIDGTFPLPFLQGSNLLAVFHHHDRVGVTRRWFSATMAVKRNLRGSLWPVKPESNSLREFSATVTAKGSSMTVSYRHDDKGVVPRQFSAAANTEVVRRTLKLDRRSNGTPRYRLLRDSERAVFPV